MKLRHIIPALILIIITCSCHYDQHKRQHKKHKQKSAHNDTLFITKRSAISVWLDTATLEKRRKQYGDDDFYVVADDDVFYANGTDSILKAQKLPVIDARDYKYLKFVQSNGSVTLIKIDTLTQLYTMYFFDPSKKPREADITMIEDDYKSFYH